MSLKFEWRDKQDGVDDILSEDINSIAHAVIESEEKIENLFEKISGGGSVEIVQETGESTEAVMSQKATTDALDGKLDKVTETHWGPRIYGVNADGSQVLYGLSWGTSADSIAIRTTGGALSVGTPLGDAHAVPRGYANEHYVSKATSPFILPRAHCVQANGLGEELITVNQQASDGSIPRRGVGGVVEVGEPKADNHAATKKYVDTQLAAVARHPRVYIDWVKDIESQFWIEDDGEVYEENRGTYIFGDGRYDVYVGFDTDATKGVATFEPFCFLTNPDFDTDDFNLNQITVTGDTNAVSVYVDRNCSDFTYCPVMSFNRTTDAMPEHFLLDIEEYKREGCVQLLIHVRHIVL